MPARLEMMIYQMEHSMILTEPLFTLMEGKRKWES